jgi:uncharacterized protein with PIN domain
MSSPREVTKQAYFRFYAELNDFLPEGKRYRTFAQPFTDRNSVKDMIESLGVPHTEVDLVLVNGESVDFSRLVEDGDRISVYPMFESLDISSVTRLRPQPLREPRFVLDVHLGKLARYLRMLGFDSLYRNDYTDAELARLSVEERRILLTRDPGLLKRSVITHGYCLRSPQPLEQVKEVVRRFNLAQAAVPFSRCIHCNERLRPTSLEAVYHQVPPAARELHDQFFHCPGCGRVYWKGSHYTRMREVVRKVLHGE